MNQFKVGDVVKCVDNSCVAFALKEREKYTVLAVVGEYIVVEDDGDFEEGDWKASRFELVSRPSEQKSPEEIATILWNAYKDVLNEEALEALRDVILNPPEDFTDCDEVISAFSWRWTKQGEDFWLDVHEGKYNKPSEPHSEHLYEDERLTESIAQLEQIKEVKTPIKSDGGSSDYYKILVKLPMPLYDKDGNLVTKVVLETQDLLYAMFRGEWSCCNIGKAALRIAAAMHGGGKEGTSIAYDAKKAIWFGEDILRRFGEER